MGSVRHAPNMSSVKTSQTMPMTQQQAAIAAFQWQQRRVPSLVNGNLQPKKPLHDLKVTTPQEHSPKQYTLDVSKANMANGFTLTRSGKPTKAPQLKMPTAAPRNTNPKPISRVPQQQAQPTASACFAPTFNRTGWFNIEACSDEEAASQLLNLTRGSSANDRQSLDTDTKSTCSSNMSGGNSKGGKRQKKVRQSDRYHRCLFCQRQYGCLSALSLHLRMKHPNLVKAMLGMDQSESVQPIHARSIGAYANDVMTRKLFRPVRTLEEAVHICAVTNGNQEEDSGSKKVSTTMGVPERVSTVKAPANVIGPSGNQRRFNDGFMAPYHSYASAPMSFGPDMVNYGFTGYRQEAVQA